MKLNHNAHRVLHNVMKRQHIILCSEIIHFEYPFPWSSPVLRPDCILETSDSPLFYLHPFTNIHDLLPTSFGSI
jgi:hypothetical protein